MNIALDTVAIRTLIRKETTRILRIWVQTIVPPAITMTLYFVIFGSLIGRRIGEIDGVPCMTFIAPGLIMMSVITNSFGNVVSSFFAGNLQLHLEELLDAPISTTATASSLMPSPAGPETSVSTELRRAWYHRVTR